MYVTSLKALLVTALQQTFDQDYIEADFRNIKVGIEYPVAKQDYPSIWVDWAQSGNLRIAGVSHKEFAPLSADLRSREFTRWFYAGEASFSIAAMTSFERDRILDELVRVFAFGQETPQTSEFRSMIELNEFIAANANFDEIGIQGSTVTGGTPWGTDDLIYEVTASLSIVGEFVSDGSSRTLIPLSAVAVYPHRTDEPPPAPVADENGWM